jgi:hypothetical protein
VSVVRWNMGLAILAIWAAPAMAQSSIQTAFNYNLDDAPAAAAPAEEKSADASTGCCEQANGCCSEASCGCENGCCNSCGCGCGDWCDLGLDNCWPFCCCCDLGDPWTLKSCLTPCCECGPDYGGWVSIGYYNNCERLSITPGDELSINDWPNHLNLDQAWFYVGKAAKTDSCCCDYGYRFDIAYGTQIHAAQSFGNDGGTWDVTWDHGPYEWAIPQLYGEVGWNDWSVKVGHFWTVAGYEVVPATGNFFYSHALTWYNTEPFMHTGVLGTYTGIDQITLYTGWSLGWDTGFDQFGAGNMFLGGVGYAPSDCFSFTYVLTAGNLGWKSNNTDGYSHSIVAVTTLSNHWKYVLSSDYLTTDDNSAGDGIHQDDKSIVNYVFYTINDCWALGSRIEWWKSNNVVVGDNTSFYEATAGVNYRPLANLVVRPEIRYDWTPAADTVNQALGKNYDQWWFGIDGVYTF